MNNPQQNQQLIFVEQGVVELRPQPLPEVGAEQLLIRTRVSLISPGTERAFFLGLPNTTQTYPQLPGYSNIGEVVQVGDYVTGWTLGDRIASAANHAAYVAVGAHQCVPVPPQLPDEEAAFFNLTSIALQGVRKARIELGEPVAIIGAGLVGLLALQLAKLNGALPAITVDQNPRRLQFAQQIGADAIATTEEEASAYLADLGALGGASVVIEATGHPQATLTALSLTRAGGRVILLGSTRGETDHVNFYRDIHKKGITVIGAHDSARPQVESYAGWWTQQDDQRLALQLLALHRLPVQPLTTHRFVWQKATEAYDLLKQWDHDVLGILLDWRA